MTSPARTEQRGSCLELITCWLNRQRVLLIHRAATLIKGSSSPKPVRFWFSTDTSGTAEPRTNQLVRAAWCSVRSLAVMRFGLPGSKWIAPNARRRLLATFWVLNHEAISSYSIKHYCGSSRTGLPDVGGLP